jgi:uncharacterized membrane protein
MEHYALVMRVQRAFILAGSAFAVFLVWSAWGDLPLRMESHFDAGGRPDGYMSRDAFFATLATLGGGTVLLLMLVPVLLRVVPSSAINLPHRDYWLAPERREPSIQRIAVCCGWFAVATAALFVMVVALTLRANVEHTGLDMTACRTGLGLYLASTVLLLVGVYRQFRRPSDWQATTPR